MYPNLGYLFEQLFGRPAPGFLYVFQSFGFMMAVAFLAAAYVLSGELKRKEKLGLLKPVSREVTVGAPASVSELVFNGLIGFVLGFKLVEIALNAKSFMNDPQQFIFSAQGNLIGGVAVAALLVFMKYREKEKKRLPSPEKKVMLIHPHQLVGDITIIAAISGIIGSKVLDSVEHIHDLIADPVGTLLSFSGLAFYGGLIFGSVAIIYFCMKNKLNVLHMADAIAPTLILAYGIGRIGCQVAGDGDWGVFNSAYITDSSNCVVSTSSSDFNQIMHEHSNYFISNYGSFDAVPHKFFKAPSFLPLWMVAESYPHNVNHDGVLIEGCAGKYCHVMPVPVIPTPIYETTLALIIFIILMFMRKRLQAAGMIFSLYLLLNGIERFFIEMIRVNDHYNILGIELSQAQIIAMVIFILGIAGLIYFPKRKNNNPLSES